MTRRANIYTINWRTGKRERRVDLPSDAAFTKYISFSPPMAIWVCCECGIVTATKADQEACCTEKEEVKS